MRLRGRGVDDVYLNVRDFTFCNGINDSAPNGLLFIGGHRVMGSAQSTPEDDGPKVIGRAKCMESTDRFDTNVGGSCVKENASNGVGLGQ
jgi:hypothetical protein